MGVRATPDPVTVPLRSPGSRACSSLRATVQRGVGIRLCRYVAPLRNLPITCSANPVDVVVRVDAAGLVKAASPAEGEADEALEARVERIEQLRRVEHARPRLVVARLMPRTRLRMS